MDTLLLSSDDPFNLHLPVVLAIAQYKGQLYHQENNLPHPGALINSSWGNLLNRIEAFFQAYDEYEGATKLYGKPSKPYTPKNIGDPSHAKVLNEYENLIYTATELIETLLSNLKKCVLPKERYSEWNLNIPKRYKDYPAIICNTLKHNHNLLVSIEGFYHLGTVRGYAVCNYVEEALKPNRDIHKDGKPLAFGNDLRHILAHIYLIAYSAYLEIERLLPLEQNPDKLEKLKTRDINLLIRASNFMPLAFHHYRTSDRIPLFKFDGNTLSISDNSGVIIPPGHGTLSTTYSGDGYTRAFHLF